MAGSAAHPGHGNVSQHVGLKYQFLGLVHHHGHPLVSSMLCIGQPGPGGLWDKHPVIVEHQVVPLIDAMLVWREGGHTRLVLPNAREAFVGGV